MKLTALLLSCLAAASLHAEDTWSPEAGFTSLFNGKDLTGWCFRAKVEKKDPKVGAVTEKFDGKTESSDAGRYSAKDGILTVNFPKGQERLVAQLYTVAEFPKNFILKLEFRASPNADSGVFIRKPQLQCRDYLVAGPYKELKQYKAQDWNQIIVEVKDGIAHCTCNGEVLEAALKLPETGPIGLEGDRGQMEYRRLQIKELP
ncbi:MAG: 3-keto-disaccharide hydrolase [Prosthecobacter sp.]